MSKIHHLKALCIIFLFFSCSSKKHDNLSTRKHAANNNVNLTEADYLKFETWKQSFIKTCDASEAFSNTHTPQAQQNFGIDLSLLAKMPQSNGLVLLDSGLVILGSPNSFPGTSVSKIARETIINNNSTKKLNIEFRRTALNCEVFNDNTKIFETRIAASLPLVASIRQKHSATGTIPDGIPIPKQTGAWSTLDISPVFTALNNALLTNKTDQIDTAKILGINEKIAEILLPLQGIGGEITLATNISDTVFYLNKIFPELIANTNAAESFFSVPQNFSVTMLVKSPTQSSSIRVSFSSTGQKIVDETNALLYRIIIDNPVQATEYNPQQAIACFTTRFKLLRESDTESHLSQHFFPTFGNVATPCMLYVDDIYTTLFNDSNTRELSLQLFSEITGSPTQQYNSWDTLLEKFAWLNIKSSSSTNLLHITGSAPILDATVLNTTNVKAAWHEETLAQELNKAATRWALSGFTVNTERVQLIADSLHTSFNPFLASTSSAIRSLANNPFGSDSELSFARALSEEYKTLATDVFKLAESMGVVAVIAERFERVLQQTWSINSWAAWQTNLNSGKSFRDKDIKLATDSERIRYENDFVELIQLALDENFVEPDFANISTLAKVAKQRLDCQQYSTVLELVHCAGLNTFSKKSGKFLSETFAGRYLSLANNVVSLLSKLTAPELTIEKNNLARTFYDPIWAQCDNPSFQIKSENLTKTVLSMASTTNFNTRFTLQRDFRNILNDCNM